MRLTNLEINHFRGIRKSTISFPKESRIICLIGSGDSTKSTVLKAIEWIFYPSWSLSACDGDFFDCDVKSPIVLRATFTEVPPKLLSDDKFGLYLQRRDVSLEVGVDEPKDKDNACLTIQLTIDKTLEPKWEIVCNGREPRQISYSDRRLLAV